MKNILLLFCLSALPILSFAQTNQQFVQLQLTTEMGEQEIRELDNSIREKSEIQVCRIDLVTKRVFILTNEGSTVVKQQLKNWFELKNADFTCFYSGVYTIDPIRKYPFQNCEE